MNVLRATADTDTRLRQPRQARPGIFAPPNAPADASGVRRSTTAAR